MKISLLLVLIVGFATPVFATSGGGIKPDAPDGLTSIAEVANSICGKLVQSGSATSSIITYDLSNLSNEQKTKLVAALNKTFDQVQLNVNTDSLTVKSIKYSGVPHNEVAKVNSATRKCLKEVALAILD